MQDAHSYVVQGFALQKNGQKAQAEASLRKATEMAPGNAYASYLLGSVQHDLAKPADAEASLRKAVEIDPGNADARLAAILVKKDPPEAKRQVTAVTANAQVLQRHTAAAAKLSRILPR